MSRAVDWYIDELILRGPKGGGSGYFGRSPELYWATSTNYLIILDSSAQAQSIGTLVG